MAKLALLIGESSPQRHSPTGGENSVIALKQVLQHPEIGCFTEVRTLDNSQPLVIQQAIEALFSDRQPDDLVLLYFSGQSIQDERGKLYLATRATRKDAQGKLVKSTAIPADFLQDVMNDSRSLQQVVILNCVDGENSGKNGLAQNTAVHIGQLSGPGRVILTASTSTHDHQGSSLSIYADSLVEALRTGAADLNEDGLVFLDELHEYTRRKIQIVAPAIQPRIYPARRNQILLAKVPVSHLGPRHPQGAIASSLEQQHYGAGTPVLLNSSVRLASREPASAATPADPLSPPTPVATRALLVRAAGITVLVLALTGIIYSLARQWQDIQQLKMVQALAARKDYEQCLVQVPKLPERLSRKSATEELLMQCQAGATWQHPQVQTLMGHTDWVWSIAISPHGQVLASGSRDKTIKLWDLRVGRLVRTLPGHTSDVFSVAISSDGRTLASGSNDKTIKLWDLRTGRLLRTLTGHRSDILSVAFSPDGQTLASGSKDRTIRLWNPSTGQSLHTLVGHTDSLRAVAFSPDGQTLASGSWDKTVKIWQLPKGRLLHTIAAHDRYVTTIAYAPWSDANSPQGQILASGSDDSTIKLWNPQTGELLRSLRVHVGHINSVAFSAGRAQNPGATLASGSQDKTIKVVQRN